MPKWTEAELQHEASLVLASSMFKLPAPIWIEASRRIGSWAYSLLVRSEPVGNLEGVESSDVPESLNR